MVTTVCRISLAEDFASLLYLLHLDFPDTFFCNDCKNVIINYFCHTALQKICFLTLSQQLLKSIKNSFHFTALSAAISRFLGKYNEFFLSELFLFFGLMCP